MPTKQLARINTDQTSDQSTPAGHGQQTPATRAADMHADVLTPRQASCVLYNPQRTALTAALTPLWDEKLIGLPCIITLKLCDTTMQHPVCIPIVVQ